MYGLTGKVIIITGCGNDRGLGFAMAKAFAEEGARLAIVDICPSEEIEMLGSQLRDAGAADVLAVQTDVSDEGQVTEMTTRVAEHYGTIDVLVNNAGIMRVNRFLEMSASDWDLHYNVMLKGTFLCSREVIKIMIRQKVKGKIVNLASVGGKRPWIYSAPYCACKAGIINLTQVCAAEFSKYGINVNGIAPGDHDTDMLELCYREGAKMEGVTPDAFRETAIRAIPMGHLGTVSDIANMCLFLSSQKADFIAGQVINVNGGVYMQ
jgi:NAD(P)-dependent dehydrogenase (short-subunit alcohol dehydrogenase family)